MATSRRHDSRGGPGVEGGNVRAARAVALDSLARRDRSSEDLRRRLIDKGFDAEVARGVVERLCAEKLLDDRRFVENFVSFHAARGQGPLRIRAELRRSGTLPELVEQAIEAYPAWVTQLRKAHQKKFGTQLPSDFAEKHRRGRFLMARGFTGAQIRLALGFDIDLDEDVTL